MKNALPGFCLARHGETEWSLSGHHARRTDVPLTERGERNASLLGTTLKRPSRDPNPGRMGR
jgi:probable phosphoglycerate mutase